MGKIGDTYKVYEAGLMMMLCHGNSLLYTGTCRCHALF